MSVHGARIREILDATTAAQQRFSGSLGGVSETAALLAPQDGGWNAAEIGMHVAITNEWIAGVLSGEIPSAKPAPPGFREDWSVIVIPDRTNTFPSLIPPAGVTRTHAMHRLVAADAHVRNAIANLTEDRAKQVVILPFGTLSLYQVAEFAGMHTNRHMVQLQRLEIPIEA